MTINVECSEEIRKIMFLKQFTFTDVVKHALQEYVQSHKDIIKKYNDYFGRVANEKGNNV